MDVGGRATQEQLARDWGKGGIIDNSWLYTHHHPSILPGRQNRRQCRIGAHIANNYSTT